MIYGLSKRHARLEKQFFFTILMELSYLLVIITLEHAWYFLILINLYCLLYN